MAAGQNEISGTAPLIARTDAWAAANPGSKSLTQRARRVLPGGVTHDVRRAEPFPVAVARAEGSHKWDLDGHELVCYVMGHGALLLGHSAPPVVAAVRQQATQAFHPGACHELECEWAELIVDLVPSAELVRFTASGTEASLLALRLARAATGRERIVKLAGHFHGWHDQVCFGTDPPFRGPDTAGVPDVLGQVVTVVPADAQALADVLGGGDVAAVILEPSGAAWGTVPLPAGLLATVRELTRAAGTILVFDEVVSGFRWSPGGVQAVAGVTPDLTALGKILAGGMPGGAVAGRADLLGHLSRAGDDPLRVAHPGTHNAHPISAAAGIAALRECRSGEPQRRAARLAAGLRAGLTSVLAEAGVPGRAYGESSTFHLLIGHAGEPEQASLEALKAAGMSPELSAELHTGMLLEGVHLFHGSGFVSAAHTERDVDRTVAAFAATLARLPAGLLP
ncbi:MAG TPA: aminotransferase class III-fold pyridoxal phosphate-dependent enzyme [Streptosporangiaceae bacterium]|nr:aminotransferase class III-fold pyridoxal phosphate-dependent enzyme [Streptosporangiaceae bacterium]